MTKMLYIRVQILLKKDYMGVVQLQALTFIFLWGSNQFQKKKKKKKKKKVDISICNLLHNSH